ncbi:hypothetical protein KM043_005149 [Ampulex compressa]|nr:hypothetical protein KM043_005149 [Ampulex compressa]
MEYPVLCPVAYRSSINALARVKMKDLLEEGCFGGFIKGGDRGAIKDVAFVNVLFEELREWRALQRVDRRVVSRGRTVGKFPPRRITDLKNNSCSSLSALCQSAEGTHYPRRRYTQEERLANRRYWKPRS